MSDLPLIRLFIKSFDNGEFTFVPQNNIYFNIIIFLAVQTGDEHDRDIGQKDAFYSIRCDR